MSYRVRLHNFEGPLDLLLFLIRKNEVDIYDIPIAEITRQYLEYVDLMQSLDLEVASAFIVMAATLIRIKAQMLLPRPIVEGEEPAAEDPRRELVERLLEYQRYKELALNLSEREEEQLNVYGRLFFDFPHVAEAPDLPETKTVTLFDLLEAVRKVLERLPEESFHTVEAIPVTVEEQSAYILDLLQRHGQTPFLELVSQLRERIRIVVTFLAILELIRQGRIVVHQRAPFTEIWLYATP